MIYLSEAASALKSCGFQVRTNGYKVAIDAGHQATGDSGMEPEGPGSSKVKAKVSSGATGVASGVPEYKLNLQVAKKIQKRIFVYEFMRMAWIVVV